MAAAESRTAAASPRLIRAIAQLPGHLPRKALIRARQIAIGCAALAVVAVALVPRPPATAALARPARADHPGEPLDPDRRLGEAISDEVLHALRFDLVEQPVDGRVSRTFEAQRARRHVVVFHVGDDLAVINGH